MLVDISLLITEYEAHYLQISFKTVVYSIKLKVEFMVLERLRSLTRICPCVCYADPSHPRRSRDINICDMVMARARMASDLEAPPNFDGARPLSSPNSTFDIIRPWGSNFK